MPKVDQIQNSFVGGEFGESLYGRSDITQYNYACAVVENMLVRPYGSVISTPGTWYIAEAKSNSNANQVTNSSFEDWASGTSGSGYYYTKLLCHFDGADGATSLTASTIQTITFTNAELDDAKKYLGTTSVFCNNGNVTVPDSADWNFGASPFTIEMFYLPSSGTLPLFSQNTDKDNGVYTYMSSGGNVINFAVVSQGSIVINSGCSCSASTTAFNHFVLSFDGSNYYLLFNGELKNTVTSSSLTLWANYTGVFKIGAFTNQGGANFSASAWFDEVRITKGLCLYNSDYTIPTNAFEYDDWGDPDDWTSSATGVKKVFRENNIVYSSSYSTGLVRSAGNLKLEQDVSTALGIAYWQGKTIEFSCWAYATKPSQATLYIYDGVGYSSPVYHSGTAGWELLTVTRLVDASADQVTISPRVVSYDGAAYFDLANAVYTGTPSSSTTRLIPFVFSKTDSYIIEMGQYYFRFYTDQAAVISSGTTVLEVTHPYTESQLMDVQYSQVNDVIYFFHKSHPPKQLTRISANNWTFADFAYTGGPYIDDNTSVITMAASATAGTNVVITLSATSSTISFVASGSTLGHRNTYWKMGGNTTVGTLGIQGYFQITSVSSSTQAKATIISPLSSSAATTDWAEAAWSGVRGFPARCTFHEGRLFAARTDYEPQKVWGSRTFSYTDFTVGAEDDDALNLALASNQSNEIQWLASGKNLVAGTYGGEFVISGDGVLTPTTINVERASSWGSESIIPVKISNFFYYVQRFGKKIRELFYFWDLDSHKSVDKTILSPHILGNGVVDMAFQQNPETVIWCVRSDGEIATLTREIDQEVQGWARQTTSNGLYESVACIPSQSYSYDEVWVIVNRTINGVSKRYIEVFENTDIPDRQDKCLYLHSALHYDAYEATNVTATTLTLSVQSGTNASLTTSLAYFSAGDVGQRVRAIDSDGSTLGEALITSVSTTTLAFANITTSFNALDYSGGEWGVSVSEVSGLGHLDTENVRVLADGGLDGRTDFTVSGGTITLNSDYFVVSVGLQYTSTLQTLPKEVGSGRGTAQGKKQRINQVAFKVNRSYKGFNCGGETDYLESVYNYIDGDSTPETLYTGVITNVSFRDDYKYGSQVLITNEEPLPIEILNIITTIETFDK